MSELSLNRCVYSLFTLLTIVFLPSCNHNMLSINTDYVTVEDLASFYVNTPDPLLNRPPFGQRLTVSWSIPKRCFQFSDTHLILTVRFRNREQVTKKVSLRKPSGSYILCLSRNQYCEKRGILTYKVQLVNGDCILEERKHQLWAELIIFEGVESGEEGVDRDFDLEERDFDMEEGDFNQEEGDFDMEEGDFDMEERDLDLEGIEPVDPDRPDFIE